ncbi:MAG: hypothetical protein AB7I18_02805 [Candidatus Berkiella sp.]
MQLFLLTPFNPKWPISQFTKFESIIVRALSEAKARNLVKRVTFNADLNKIGQQVHNPWQNRSFSRCEVYQGTEFTKAGKEEVLTPLKLRDYFLQLKK